MLDEIGEECGITAVSLTEGNNNSLYYIYKILLNLQNRGQLSAGATTYNKDRKQLLHTHRDIGTVNEVFRTSFVGKSKSIFRRYAGNKGIGHVRYATSGSTDRLFAQPFERHHGRLWKWFSFGFNGNLVNHYELKNKLTKQKQYHFILENDTELVMHYLSKELGQQNRPSMRQIFSSINHKFEGAFNITFINGKGDVVASRDPLGFRPLVYGIKDNNVFVASESNALLNVGVEKYKSVDPGKIVHVENGNINIKRCAKSPKKAHCMFEWVYFANVSSVIDGRSVYQARANLGKELAKIETEDVDENYIVVPIPDSSKAAGDAYAYELGLPSREGLIRNRYVGRTFIEGTSRKDKIQNKYTIQKEVIRGKKILLVDDSVVRGATTELLVKSLKQEAGAKEVHVRISCPPILGPCFYGIDMSTISELIAPKFMKEPADEMPIKSAEKMAKHLGADSVIYQTIPGLIRSIGLTKKDLCLGCLNLNYPTPTGRKYIKMAKENIKNGRKEISRIYDQASKCGC